MKKNKILFSVLIAALFFLPKISFAEEIKSFNQEIKIQKNSDIVVEETIVYDFGTEQKHGIYRYIPYKYETERGPIKMDINFIGAKDENGNSYKYKTGLEGNNVYIRIGREDVLITGVKTYKIIYRVSGVINFFEDHDELFWNVTGNQWEVPIKSASAKVILPDIANKKSLKVACYTGVYGSRENFCKTEFLSEKEFQFSTYKPLNPSEGLTIVFGFPRGIVNEPTTLQKIGRFLSKNFLIFLPFLLFLIFFFLWGKEGKDPEGRGTIIAEYEPPQGIKPPEANAILKECVDVKGITATIIDLARRGYLRIKETEEKKLGVFKSKDWELQRTQKPLESEDIEDYEKKFIEDLFSASEIKKLSDLKEETSLILTIQNFQNKVIERVTEKGYFSKDPSKVTSSFISKWGLLLLIIFFVAMFLKKLNFLNTASIIISFVLVVIFGRAMPSRTKEGKRIQEKLLGFKEFLSVTEKDRVKFHFSPEVHPEKFAEYLPFAIVFGVEKEWAELFKGTDLQKPEWYEGSWVGGYSAFVMADSLSHFSSSFGDSIKSAGASAAASGSSGFGGGGFSGGGFGGGGGGSW